ncbi:Zinc finger CCCH domain-containing protein 6 [Acropora cervicornis]|uniref:Zinc finger CCCH domain-containing protein 6 n=1 Tax=Acropora cervicornis TaxID=6130 RepID=A0AAD9QVC3_ACRCE|nr:Zinc finger CCCH domain-containing protein 6 [Acropora cervicornis]
MPLKDILSKPPARIPSSEDPWPKPQPSPPQAPVPKTTSNTCAVNDYRTSPLYSTGRPTLDEFLRTDYLMIPEFLMQVNKAKKAAGIVENKPLVENTKSSTQMGLKNVEKTFSVCPTQLPKALSYAPNPKEGKGVERKEVPVKYTGSAAPHVTDKLTFVGSRNRINSNIVSRGDYDSSEIQTPSSVVRPKQRVKKVMKGGSLVIIPAPEPKNRSLQGRQASLEGNSRETTSGIVPDSSGTRKKGFELLKETCHEDNVNGKGTNETNNNYSGMKPDVRTFNQENANLPKFSPTESKQFNSENSLKDKQSVAVCKTLLVTSSEEEEGILEQNMRLDSELESGKPFCDDENRLTDFILKQRSKDDEIDPVTDENGESRMEAKVVTDTRNHSGHKSPVLNAAPKKEKSNAKYKEKEHKGLKDFHSLQDNSTHFSKIEEMVKFPDDLPVVAFNQKLSNEIEREEGVESDKRQTENPDNPAVVDVLENLVFTSTRQKKGELLGQDECGKVDNDVEDNKTMSVSAIDRERISDSVSTIVVCGNDIDLNDCDSDTGNDDQVHYDDVDADKSGDEVSEIDSLKGDDNADDEEDGVVSSDNDDDEVVCSKENSGEEGDDDYAELVMDGSDSDVDEEEDDFIRGNDDTTEESSDMKSDYDTEDMNLDSDPESNVGGITFYHDTTLSEKRKHLRYRKRLKRKAKNQKKNTRHKKAKIEQQGVNEKNRSEVGPNCGGKAADPKNIHVHNTSSKTSVRENGTKQLESVNQTITGTPSTNQRDTGAAQNKPSAQNSAEEGSLLSMVSSCAVDVTVAASEKIQLRLASLHTFAIPTDRSPLAIKRSRGGQHAKKLKKAKRKAAALERIRNGEPHPRHSAKRQAEPKPICNFYIHGKCRKGEQCPFRHVKSAVVKKKEIGSKCWEAERCKFSHDPLTAETWNLLQTVLNPPPEDSIQQSQDTNPLPADTQTAAANQNTSNTNSWSEDTSPVSASSIYNFRESTRKRSLDTNEARDCHVTGEDKSSRKESPRKKDGRGSFFVPGMYKDTSV